MTLVRRRIEPFPLEDVAQVSAAVAANDLGPHHAKGAILVPRHGPGNAVEVGRPAAARVELVRGVVQGRVAPGAGVDACGGVVLVELASAGRFCALLAEDAKLFCIFYGKY